MKVRSKQRAVSSKKQNAKRVIRAIFVCLLLTAPLPTDFLRAQQKKVSRIGYLSPLSPTGLPVNAEAFRQGLRDLGWVEGQNIVIEYRWADGAYARLPNLAAELAGLKVDVIFTQTTPGVLAARKATPTIPIVVVAGATFVELGRTITGITLATHEQDSKRIGLIKEAIPTITQVAILVNPANSGFQGYPNVLEEVALTFDLRLFRVEARGLSEFESALSRARKERADALLVTNDAIFNGGAKSIAAIAVRHQLPSISERREFAEEGGLIAYGPNLPEVYRQAAGYVDKILRGSEPRNLRVERPKKFEFVINLKTATQIGLTIPPNVLARADKVIK